MEHGEPLLDTGEIFAGKYAIVRKVGEGGMGVVYEALHVKLQQPVAIKMLHGDARRSPDVVRRFEREARAAARLHGAHVARVLDVDTAPDRSPFMVMELLEGNDLADEMATRAIRLGQAIDWTVEACEAMAEAHAIGIVHRDLKPSNLFLAEAGGRRTIKVLDFGISKVNREQDVSVTTTQSTLGTPRYMSPEQIRSAKSVDGRGDVWSLGVILYEMLAGRPPFDEQNATAMVAAIAADVPTDLRELRPDLPADLVDAIMKTLEKDPARRFQTVQELSAAISPWGEGARAGSSSDLFPDRASAPRISRPDRRGFDETLPSPPREEAQDTVAAAPEPANQVSPVAASVPAPTPRARPFDSRWAFAGGGALLVAAVVFGAGASREDQTPGAEPAATQPPAVREPSAPRRDEAAQPTAQQPAVTPVPAEPSASSTAAPRPKTRRPPASAAAPPPPAAPPPAPAAPAPSTPLHL